MDLGSISIFARGPMAGKDTSINGAMTTVHLRRGRWAAAFVPVQ